jgi:hypothetical protein
MDTKYTNIHKEKQQCIVKKVKNETGKPKLHEVDIGTSLVFCGVPMSDRAQQSVIIVSQRLYGSGQVAATYALFVRAVRVQGTKHTHLLALHRWLSALPQS